MELEQWQERARLLKVLKPLRTGKSQQFLFSGDRGEVIHGLILTETWH